MRSSPRVPLELPVALRRDGGEERTRTIVVNRAGAKVLSRRAEPVNARIRVELLDRSDRPEIWATVVWTGRQAGDWHELGIKLEIEHADYWDLRSRAQRLEGDRVVRLTGRMASLTRTGVGQLIRSTAERMTVLTRERFERGEAITAWTPLCPKLLNCVVTSSRPSRKKQNHLLIELRPRDSAQPFPAADPDPLLDESAPPQDRAPEVRPPAPQTTLVSGETPRFLGMFAGELATRLESKPGPLFEAAFGRVLPDDQARLALAAGVAVMVLLSGEATGAASALEKLQARLQGKGFPLRDWCAMVEDLERKGILNRDRLIGVLRRLSRNPAAFLSSPTHS
jgi:hypothetical protein